MITRVPVTILPEGYPGISETSVKKYFKRENDLRILQFNKICKIMFGTECRKSLITIIISQMSQQERQEEGPTCYMSHFHERILWSGVMFIV